MLLRGDDGRFRYALPDGTRLRASSMTASDPASRSDEEVSLLASFDRKAPFRILEASAAKSAKRKAVSRNMAKVADESYLNTFPTKGSPRCLAILVQFQDVKFTLENPNALFKDMLNEEGFNRHRATGSAADYFKASSNGQFAPQFDVYGPVTLPYNMSYYGGNDMTGNDARPYEMVPHAVDLLRDQIDFSIYDTQRRSGRQHLFLLRRLRRGRRRPSKLDMAPFLEHPRRPRNGDIHEWKAHKSLRHIQ